MFSTAFPAMATTTRPTNASDRPRLAIVGLSASTNRSEVRAAPAAPTTRRPSASGSGQAVASDGSRSSRLAPAAAAERERDRGHEHHEQDDRDDGAQVRRRGRHRARRASWRGSGSPVPRRRAGATSRASGPAGAWNVCVPWRSPPMRNARPSTSSVLARIDPIRAVWTTTTRPACSAKIEMNSSGRLPRADWRMPVVAGPKRSTELVGPLPDQRGEGRQRDRADHEHDRLAGAESR